MNNDSLIVEDERTYNWTSECNNCHKNIWWNFQVRHRETKRCLPMESEYVPGGSVTRHKCMSRGQGHYINKYPKQDKDKKVFVPDKSNFWRDNVVHTRDNNIMKQAKIDRWRKLTNYGYVDRQKTLSNIKLVKQWERHSFEY